MWIIRIIDEYCCEEFESDESADQCRIKRLHLFMSVDFFDFYDIIIVYLIEVPSINRHRFFRLTIHFVCGIIYKNRSFCEKSQYA